MRVLAGLVLLVATGACIDPKVTTCEGGLTCPAGNVCDSVHHGCATEKQILDCDGKADFESCAYPGVSDGQCFSGVCLPSGCGNGSVDGPEVCDDGNRLHGDGCSADCRSTEVCGNGVVDTVVGEACDDGNTVDGDGCQATCLNPTCGDGIIDAQFNEQCDLGAANSNAPDATCRPNCQPERCGDGVTDTGEICDDGNTTSGDGCAADCNSNETCGNGVIDVANNETCDDGNTSDGDGCEGNCQSPRCGDGIVDPQFNEGCDNGAANSNNPDAACRTNCLPKRCGDMIVDTGEVCDDGNVLSGDGCSGDCKSDETCGNGYLDVPQPAFGFAGEQCDDDNTTDGDGCQGNCKAPYCGDGIKDNGLFEECDSGSSNNDVANACRTTCRNPRCGDNIKDAGESCDDGDTTSGDGCSADCLSDETCGNGYVDVAAGEACDPTSPQPGACRLDCTIPGCGDGILDVANGEACDNGLLNSNQKDAACRLNCQPKRCGDAVKDTGEVCDDGDIIGGDGCSADCLSLETCGNGYVDIAAGEDCDPAAPNSGTCRANCTVPFCGDGTIDTSNGEGCDAGLLNSNAKDAACRTNCQPKRCGDAIKDTGEVCDDGDLIGGDGCSADCLSNETCGNGYVDIVAGEACDPGAANAGNCRGDCTIPRCGDAIVDAVNGEGCDEGDGANSDAADATCRTNCQPIRCGDGITDPSLAEVCDDGNLFSGDGCSGDCRSNEVCSNSYLDAITLEECDDTNPAGLAHDGCSSTCKLEIDLWRNITPGPPTGREQISAAYDAARNQMVVFGGFGLTGAASNDTLLWNGTGWYAPFIADGPSARAGYAIAYDTSRNRVVMFGGGTSLVEGSNETWEWDGTKWQLKNPATKPPARTNTRAVYDSARSRVVLFGGQQAGIGATYNDVWEWDGTNWTKITTTNPPPARMRHGMAYDAASARIVVTGGWNASNQNLADTWTYDATTTTWTNTGTTIGLRHDINMAYDPVRQRVVLFGGVFGSINPYSDTMEWNGSSWSTKTPATVPPARFGNAMAYDTSRQRIVINAGSPGSNSVPLGDVYEWDGTNWSLRTPVSSPTARDGAAMAYDAARGRIVLFGGQNAALSTLSDTWEFDGRNWLQRTPATTPPARVFHTMTYDSVKKKVVMFGGSPACCATKLDDLWEWDGTNWNQIPKSGSWPLGRYGAALVSDDARGELILYGGFDSANAYGTTTWRWKNNAWTQLAPATTPDGMTCKGAYDAASQRIVLNGSLGFPSKTWAWTGTSWQPLASGTPPAVDGAFAFHTARGAGVYFGGTANNTTSDETWELSNGFWTQRLPAVAPGARTGAAMAYDAIRNQVVMFGGNPLNSETWSYTFSSTGSPAETCVDTSDDSDGDGLAGCADPDCWGRCTPFCPPRTSCNVTLPRCGDGACSAVEDKLICPADCP